MGKRSTTTSKLEEARHLLGCSSHRIAPAALEALESIQSVRERGARALLRSTVETLSQWVGEDREVAAAALLLVELLGVEVPQLPPVEVPGLPPPGTAELHVGDTVEAIGYWHYLIAPGQLGHVSVVCVEDVPRPFTVKWERMKKSLNSVEAELQHFAHHLGTLFKVVECPHRPAAQCPDGAERSR